MMSRSTFAQIVGYISIVWHLFLSYALLYVIGNVDEESAKESSSDESVEVEDPKYAELKKAVYEYITDVLAIGLLASVAMVIVSILLIVGVRKHSHRLVAPFVIVTTIAVFVGIVNILFDGDVEKKENVSDKFEIISCLLYAAIWYPIFKMYKKMRFVNKHPNSCPVNPHYAPYVAQTACPQPQPIAEFSHCAKYAHAEVKAPAQQFVYPAVSKV